METTNYVELYNTISEMVQDKDVAIAILQEIGKDRRGKQIAEMQQPPRQQMATGKQISFLKSLGVTFDINTLTKKEASALIEQAKAKQQNAM